MTPTPEQIQYAERWMLSRGKSPYLNGSTASWIVDDGSGSYARLPYCLIATMAPDGGRGLIYKSRESAIAALAVALAEMRAVVGVDEEVREERERCVAKIRQIADDWNNHGDIISRDAGRYIADFIESEAIRKEPASE